MLIYHNLGPTMVLGGTRVPLDHYFILEIFLNFFIHLSKKLFFNFFNLLL
jgi:hypothetical protein